MKKLACTLVFAAAIGFCASCSAVTVYDPTNYSANLETKIQMIMQVKQSAQQLQMQIKDIQSMDAKNMATAPTQLLNIYTSVDSIRKQSKAIGEDWTKSLQEWSDMNPNYLSMGTITLAKYLEYQKKSDARIDKTLEQALLMAGVASGKETQQTVESVLQTIDASNKAEGSKAALQAANQLLGLIIGENNKQMNMLSEMLKVMVMSKQADIDKANQASKMGSDFVKSAQNKKTVITNKGESLPTFRSH